MIASHPQLIISGMGLVLPCGDGIAIARASWDSQVPCFADLPENLGQGRGAACVNFKAVGIIPPMVNRRLDRASRFAWVAAREALLQAELDVAAMGNQVALAVGTLTGGQEATEAFMKPYLEQGPQGASPMIFPNSVAVAISGHLATAFNIKGPSVTQLGREASFFAALDQAGYWLRNHMAEAVLVVGADALFPMLVEVIQGARLSARQGLPEAFARHGLLPGEGSEVFVVETREHAEARKAKPLAEIRYVSNHAPTNSDVRLRAEVMEKLAEPLVEFGLDAWIGGSNGHPILDEVEAPLVKAHPQWPRPKFPKMIWGEFGGSGGQLMAAAMLEPGRRVLITAPASAGGQYAALIEKPGE